MSGYIKYFGDGRKNMSFMIENDGVLIKYNEILNKIKRTLNIKFHSMSVYDEKYIKVKVTEFGGAVNAVFSDDIVLKESAHHTCIACISIDSVMKMERKNYPQVCLEERKYKVKKRKMPGFIDAELESDSE